MIRFIRIAIFIILSCLSAQVWAKVTATVSQNPVYAGRPFTLEITANASLDASAFNRAKLMQPQFVVGQTSTGRNISDINGVTTRQTQWVTTLLVRQPGTYTIPAFNVGGSFTQPIQLQVLADTGQPIQQQYVKLETAITQKNAWENQPLLYTAKILIGTTLSDGNFSPPSAEHADVEQIGKDQQQIEIINGQRYQTLIRHWLITPHQPGPFTIKSPELTGNAGIPSDTFGMTEYPVTVQGKDQSIQVQAMPKGFKIPWLAASHLTLSDQISPKRDQYQPGQAITRTITLTAEQAGLKQLPQLQFHYPAGLRIYPEKPKDHLFIKDGKVYAQRTYTIAMIPEHSGSLKIDAQTLHWWNIDDQTRQSTTIPEIRLNIAETPHHSAATAPIDTLPSEPTSPTETSFWGYMGYALWLITLLIWLFREWSLRRKTHDKPITTGQQDTIPHDSSWRTFEKAAQSNQAIPAETALREWLAEHPEFQPLLSTLLNELAQIAWSSKQTLNWDGLEFLHRINQILKSTPATVHHKAKTQLPSLNP
ncbi:BatD family protein [Celerinatantimonas sp. YJH-8]|uniref:BatD family protein n=1 Tax=Celerinatantimonas sp. YJH-8 TaxID=3228714 RepID=UPI0038CB7320